MIKKLLLWLLPKSLWGDRIYGLYRFYRRFGRLLEIPPIRFSDHLVTLKMSGTNYDPLVQFVTDKEYAKLYIAATVGEEYTIETHYILRCREELAEFSLNRVPCVLKPTHLSGQVLICTNLSDPLDRQALCRWLDVNHYKRSREQNYRYLIPKIIVEEFISEDGYSVPYDYKFLCFHGYPRIIQVDKGRFSKQSQSFTIQTGIEFRLLHCIRALTGTMTNRHRWVR